MLNKSFKLKKLDCLMQSVVLRSLLAGRSPPCCTLTTLSGSLSGSLVERFQKATDSLPGKCRYRTGEADPGKHLNIHEGQLYTISEEDFGRFMHTGLSKHYYRMTRAFNERLLMVRKPGLEIVNYLKKANYNLPVIRYLLYGYYGTGKTLTMAYITHYCAKRDWLICHLPWAPFYNRYFTETQPSSWKAGRIDLPMEAVSWMTYFRNMNLPVLQKLNPVTTNKYVWTKRDVTDVGTPWLQLIEFGLTRSKYACDVMGALLKEIRAASSNQKVQTLVTIDGVNGFWERTQIKIEGKTRHDLHMAAELSLVHNWKKMLSNRWSGGAVVCTVDSMACQPRDLHRYLPLQLLSTEAFHTFDPCIPVQVPAYTENEAYNFIDMLVDKKWILSPNGQTDEGKRELMALSDMNPLELYKVSIKW